ncbi:dihydroorotate dehydrogenase electron transfer subunit [Desulfosarcina ovata]|uniref:Dihydroorotate dehydrogenase B (NAD(+)), electron transfer subunit n=1 Tax=Desulfosarcina ovata subsp. ovata TaxID=2752305 RepID=A0A5K8APH4_9BACT|nr:dihydroorotate dehydrogenase electron transfer subunit [Desulfosarcina ovata]BBO93504.1 dihydroorotate dehydrogenase B (NAD(+)), electron transfer subunit [Desulfosarcina ovata subsp. ovata]
MIIQDAIVLWNQAAAKGYWRLGLACSAGFESARPGQFVMVRVGRQNRPLLRRPFSLLGLIKDGEQVTGIEILFKVVGKGTEALARCRAGDWLSVIGPLGNAFLVPDDCRQLILVAGGVGVPPIRFLAQSLLEREGALDRCVVFIGGRTKDDLVCIGEFDLPGFLLDISTDDGSQGSMGVVTKSLMKTLDAGAADLICACGPPAMLKAVADIALARNIPCQVSIEAMMACGMGACLGCAVQTRGDAARYRHVCMDGPVFDARELVW